MKPTQPIQTIGYQYRFLEEHYQYHERQRPSSPSVKQKSIQQVLVHEFHGRGDADRRGWRIPEELHSNETNLDIVNCIANEWIGCTR